MSLGVTHFPDIRALLGPSWQKQKFQLHPGSVSDYPTGGYPVTANQFLLGYLSGIEVSGVNAAGKGYALVPVFPGSSFGTAPAPATSVNLVVTSGGTEVSNGADLSGVDWIVEVDGW